MACNANQLLADGMANFGELSNVQLLQVIADLTAHWLVHESPAADVSVEAVWGRAISSKVSGVPNRKLLLAAIAQNLCNTLNHLSP